MAQSASVRATTAKGMAVRLIGKSRGKTPEQETGTDTKAAASSEDRAATSESQATGSDVQAAASTDADTAGSQDQADKASDEAPGKDEARAAKQEECKEESTGTGEMIRSGSDAIRSRIATIVWLIAVICALNLAIGALLIALDANARNSIVDYITDGGDFLDGPFSRENGVVTFRGKGGETQSALVNWGIAAVAYLVVGKVLDRAIRS